MDYLSNEKGYIKNKWNSLNKKGKTIVCVIGIVIVIAVIKGA
jgi:flagellar biosynthesis/type III secretory pathway M-ring protein FliF/YscJ